MSSAKRRVDSAHRAATPGWASVRKKCFTTTPRATRNAPGQGLILTQLAGLGLVHETRIEPQLDVAAIALDGAVRVADPHDVDTAGVLTEKPMLEAEVPDKVHFLLDLGAACIIDGRFWRPEHRRGPQLRLVLVERGVRALGHGRQ